MLEGCVPCAVCCVVLYSQECAYMRITYILNIYIHMFRIVRIYTNILNILKSAPKKKTLPGAVLQAAFTLPMNVGLQDVS